MDEPLEAFSHYTAFRRAEKLYKRKQPPPAYTHVLHFHDLALNTPGNLQIIRDVTSEFIDKWIALDQSTRPKIFRIVGKPGLLVITDLFTVEEQKYWIKRCLDDYTDWTCPSNLSDELLSPDFVRDSSSKSIWTWTKIRDDRTKILSRLRWITLGYHYDWTTKTYRRKSWTPLPSDLNCLATTIAKCFSSFDDFIPEAAIINYYQVGDSLMGHRDVSEELLNAPLISISFGNDAIFLLGGSSKEDMPIALRLQNGDILIMEDDVRLAYHGIPRIIENTLPSNLLGEEHGISSEWRLFTEYLKQSRINVNLRQVWKNKEPAETN